jgi:hypothetical protein
MVIRKWTSLVAIIEPTIVIIHVFKLAMNDKQKQSSQENLGRMTLQNEPAFKNKIFLHYNKN